MEFKYKSYGTSYGYIISQKVEGKGVQKYPYNQEMLTLPLKEGQPYYEACFASLYNMMLDTAINNLYDIDIAILIASNSVAMSEHNRNNYCFLTEEEILFFLETSIPALGFSYEVKRIHNFYYIIFKGVNVSHYQVKFLTTWVRYLYEHPYSICMYETVKLFQLGIFKNLDIFNAFLLVSRGWGEWGEGHSTTSTRVSYTLLPVPLLLKSLKDPKKKPSLNRLYEQGNLANFLGSEFNKYDGLSEKELLEHWENKYLPNIRINNSVAEDSFFIVTEDFNLELKRECKHRFIDAPPEVKTKAINGRVSSIADKRKVDIKEEKYNWKF